MSDPILSSLNKIRELESKQVLNEAGVAAPVGSTTAQGVRDASGLGSLATMGAAKAAPKMLGKIGAKLVPGLGAVAGAADAYNRAKMGDTTGAAIAGITGAASTIPVVGTAAGIAGMGIQAVRDKMRTGSWMPDDAELAAGVAKDGSSPAAPTAVAQAQAPAKPGTDPKILALQQQLIAKGAKNIDGTPLKADGKMGTNTQAAMKQFPDVKMAESIKDNTMTEAERYRALVNKLESIHNQPEQVDEGPLDALKAAGSAIKTGAQSVGNFFKGAGAGLKGGAAASDVASGAANLGKAGDKGMAAAQSIKNAGQTVKTAATSNAAKNIAKVGAGAALGAGAASTMGGASASQTPAPTPTPTPTPPAKTGAPTKPAATPSAAPAVDPAVMGELDTLAREFADSQDPEIQALMQQYTALKNGKAEKRTAAEIQASNSLGDANI